MLSTRRLFHAMLEAAKVSPNGNGSNGHGAPIEVDRLSLTRSVEGVDPEQETVFAEAYVPDTLLALMESMDRAAIDVFRCRSMRRAAYRGRYKLIMVDDKPDELFDVMDDPKETHNLYRDHPNEVAELERALSRFVELARSGGPGTGRVRRS